jgi:uroporphyrinogen decarboxylase
MPRVPEYKRQPESLFTRPAPAKALGRYPRFIEVDMDTLLKEKPVALDLSAAVANLHRRSVARRIFFFEHGEEPGIKRALCDRFNLCDGLDRSDPHFLLRREIRLKQFLGQEFMRVFPAGIHWKGLPAGTTDPPPAVGPIRSWSDFESYPWPTVKDIDFSALDWYESNLADNLALWVMVYLFQVVSNLLGFESLCMMLYEDRDLVKAVTDKVGAFYLRYTQTLCQFSRLGAVNIGDDMGHKTGTLVRPDDLREIFLPWHGRIITAVHAAGKLGLFHTCGQVEAIMDDLIDKVGIDAKHSTQDVVEPITVAKARWGGRVALLGGVDVDFITRSRPEAIEPYTRNILETCAPGGGFAFGVGNWVADSIPLENYLAMLTAARTFA